MKFICIINIQLICQIILLSWEKDYIQSHSPAEFHMKENYIKLLLPNSKGNDIWQRKHSYFWVTITTFYSCCGDTYIAFTNEQSVPFKDGSLLTFLHIFLLILAYVLMGKNPYVFTSKQSTAIGDWVGGLVATDLFWGRNCCLHGLLNSITRLIYKLAFLFFIL